MSYADELGRELAAVGIRGPRRRRILAEVEDHLYESGDVAAFGEPRLVAQRFADELATVGARRSAFTACAGLAPAAIGYAALVLAGSPGRDITSARTLSLGLAATALLLLAPQVSLAAGLLAALRAWGLHSAAAPAAELQIVRRRTGVALGAGAATLAALVVHAYEYRDGLLASSIVAAAAAVPLLVAARAAWRAAGPRSAVPGGSGDLTRDLEPLVRRLPSLGTPARLCLAFAVAVALAVFVGGGLDEGPRNAVGELVAVCGGFVLFGRYLGLRRDRHCSHGSA
jgi:hypothetical protein